MPFYVTTPIYYVNDVPHLGSAYTTIVADALRRFHLLRGEETRMLTGTDEHGIRLERIAKEKGLSPQAFVDEISEAFRKAWPQLLVETDDFIRTSEPRHKEWVQELWRRIEKNGDLYEAEYEDWYCVGCESFKTEKELLPGNLCPLHLKPVERVREKTYFFRLSRFQKPLLDFYARHPHFIAPESRRNEVLSFVEAGLKDLSVSRTSFTWGIPVPDRPGHIMYVWFDALANYVSALAKGSDGKDHLRFWPPSGTAVHLVGKDILRFHAVYWPAFLLAAGYPEEALPTQVFAHGFLTVDGQKMSKSLRNAVDPLRLARELGPDVLRYHLLRSVAFGQDGDFDHAALLERYNADLGKNLGNLLNRTLGLVQKLLGGQTPAVGPLTELEEKFLAAARAEATEAVARWSDPSGPQPHVALERTWAVSSLANQYVDQAAPWAEAKKGNTKRVGTILGTLLGVLRSLAIFAWPALPQKANELLAQLGLPALAPAPGQDWLADAIRLAPLPAGKPVGEAKPLFPTFDKDAEAALLARLKPAQETAVTASADAGASATPSSSMPSSAMPSPSTPSPSTPPTLRKPDEAAETRTLISYDQFATVDLRVGHVLSAERVPKKDKLLLLKVDVGEPTPRTIVAGLALTFAPEDLVGKRVVVVANLAPRDFGKGLVSFGMLLASGPSENLRLATVPDDVAPGSKLK